MKTTDQTAYLVYDTESVVDGALLSKVVYPGEGLSAEAAVERQRADVLGASGGSSDFIAVSFHVPVAVCVARVGADLRLLDLVALDAPRHEPRAMVDLFWRGVQAYQPATLVDFNGRGFDIPLLTLAAFRFGIACPAYFRDPDRFGFRYRFTPKHIDLLEWLTEYGGFRLRGGLDLCAKLLGKPGKGDVAGGGVADMYARGEIAAINDYCLSDVLDTYFVFLRTRVLTGEITLEREQEIVAQTREWLAVRAQSQPSLATYLEQFGTWNPRPFE